MLGSFVFLMVPALASAAWSDVRSRTIPDWVSLVLIGTFAPLALLTIGPRDTLLSYGTGLAVLAAGALLFALRALGGGDVKLLAAGAVWVGPERLVELLLATTLLGGALGVLLLARRSLERRRAGEEAVSPGVPYGVAIAVAILWAGSNAPSLLGSAP